jgi:hypothetical protein
MRLLSVFLLLAISAMAEVVCALGSNAGSYNAGSYSAGSDQRPTSDALELARRMNAALEFTCSPKCPQIALFRNSTAANVMLIAGADQAKVVYAPQFFSAVYDKYGDAAVIAVLAHEFGHALDEVYPAKWMSNGWNPEMRADGWAGCALARINAGPKDLADALAAVSLYPPPGKSAWPLRLTAMRTGYVYCGGDGSKFDAGNDRSKRN